MPQKTYNYIMAKKIYHVFIQKKRDVWLRLETYAAKITELENVLNRIVCSQTTIYVELAPTLVVIET